MKRIITNFATKIFVASLILFVLLVTSTTYIQAASRNAQKDKFILPTLQKQTIKCDAKGVNDILVKTSGVIKKARIVSDSLKVTKEGVEADIEILNGTNIWFHLIRGGEGGGAELTSAAGSEGFLKYELLPPSDTSIFVHVKFTQKDQNILLQFDQGGRAIPIGLISPVIKLIPGGAGITDGKIMLVAVNYAQNLGILMDKYSIFKDLQNIEAAKGWKRNTQRLILVKDLVRLFLSSDYIDIIYNIAKDIGLDLTKDALVKWIIGAPVSIFEDIANQLVYGTLTFIDGGRSYVEFIPTRTGSPDNLLPCPPIPISPKNQVLKNNPPSFVWANIAARGKYFDIAISKDYSFTNIIYQATTQNLNHIPSVQLPENIPLYWKVRAGNTVGFSNWSRINVFGIKNNELFPTASPTYTPSPTPTLNPTPTPSPSVTPNVTMQKTGELVLPKVGSYDNFYNDGTLDEQNGFLYIIGEVDNNEGFIHKIDRKSLNIVETKVITKDEKYSRLISIDIDRSNGVAYIIGAEKNAFSDKSSLYKLDLKTFTVKDTLILPNGGYAKIKIDSIHGYAYIFTLEGKLITIDLSSFTLKNVATILKQSAYSSDQPFEIDTNKKLGYLGDGVREVYQIDLSTPSILNKLTFQSDNGEELYNQHFGALDLVHNLGYFIHQSKIAGLSHQKLATIDLNSFSQTPASYYSPASSSDGKNRIVWDGITLDTARNFGYIFSRRVLPDGQSKVIKVQLPTLKEIEIFNFNLNEIPSGIFLYDNKNNVLYVKTSEKITNQEGLTEFIGKIVKISIGY